MAKKSTLAIRIGSRTAVMCHSSDFFLGKKTSCIDFDHMDVVNADLS